MAMRATADVCTLEPVGVRALVPRRHRICDSCKLPCRRRNELVLNLRPRCVALVGIVYVTCLPSCADAPTASALSPDSTLRVDVVEVAAFIDRNFEIELTEVATGRSEIVFRSPDEGKPIGTERVVWSSDGSRFLLLGRNFFVTSEGSLEGGLQAYLMMDVRTGRIWCNARQASDYPRFGVEELRSVEWSAWTPP